MVVAQSSHGTISTYIYEVSDGPGKPPQGLEDLGENIWRGQRLCLRDLGLRSQGVKGILGRSLWAMPVWVKRLGPRAGGFLLLLPARETLGTQQLKVIHEAARIFLRIGLVESVGVFKEEIIVSEVVR